MYMIYIYHRFVLLQDFAKSSQKDGTCFWAVVCAKRSRVSIKACKLPRHSCRCIPFQVAGQIFQSRQKHREKATKRAERIACLLFTPVQKVPCISSVSSSLRNVVMVRNYQSASHFFHFQSV